MKKEDLLRIVRKIRKYAKITKNGNIIIEKNFKGPQIDKLKLSLIVRYLAEEIAKVYPEKEVRENIAIVTIEDVINILNLQNDAKGRASARSRMSELVKIGFAERVEKGKIKVMPSKIEEFIDSIEATAHKKIKKIEIDRDKVYRRLSINLGIEESRLRDILYISEDGFFKFNKMLIGKTKMSTQKNCILCCGYVFSVGFGKEKIDTGFIKEVCYHSDIDVTGLKEAIKSLKRGGYITKVKKGHQQNILCEKGKEKAREIFLKLCGGGKC